jgi:hypothetical protein
MTTRIKNCLSILSLTVFFIIAAASSHKNATFKDADNWIPKDFNPNNTVLLIQTHPVNEKQNERMIEWLEKNYPYRYEIADKSAIQNTTGKYSDTKTYPFAVLWNLKSAQRSHVGANGQPSFSTEWDLYGNFIDRSTNKVYPSTRKIMYMGKLPISNFSIRF